MSQGGQIRPFESFPIVKQIDDHTDTNTYYVQAVVRDMGDNTVIQTVNLDDKGNRRFHKVIQAPSDPSGRGRWIDITVTVYTDSGYTTKSPNYAEERYEYLVQERWNFAFGSGDGGIGLTSKDFRKIVRDEVQNQIKKIPKPIVSIPKIEIPKSRADEILKAIDKIKPTDLTRIERKIDKLPKEFNQEKVDFTEIVNEIRDLKKTDFIKEIRAIVKEKDNKTKEELELMIEKAIMKTNQQIKDEEASKIPKPVRKPLEPRLVKSKLLDFILENA